MTFSQNGLLCRALCADPWMAAHPGRDRILFETKQFRLLYAHSLCSPMRRREELMDCLEYQLQPFFQTKPYEVVISWLLRVWNWQTWDGSLTVVFPIIFYTHSKQTIRLLFSDWKLYLWQDRIIYWVSQIVWLTQFVLLHGKLSHTSSRCIGWIISAETKVPLNDLLRRECWVNLSTDVHAQ